LINGQAETLPHDKDILVICWTSLRGQEIATWLRAHGFPRAYAIQGGLQGDINMPSQPGWIDAGLPWRGHTRWSQVFAPSYSMSLDEAKKKFDNKATIIDVTSPKDYADGHLLGALSLPLETTTTAEVNRIISLVPPTADLLIYCNSYVNCFYAKVLGIRLQRLGRTYTEPFDDVNAAWKKKGYPMETSL
jgi:rhodanese-related sulfurtransferase